ncbi:unnamed protein product, partial [Staurois parvus]
MTRDCGRSTGDDQRLRTYNGSGNTGPAPLQKTHRHFPPSREEGRGGRERGGEMGRGERERGG